MNSVPWGQRLTRVGRDLDAVEIPPRTGHGDDPVTQALRQVTASSDPQVHFARFVAATVPVFAAGVEMTMTPASSEITRYSSGLSRCDADHSETITFQGREQAGPAPYAGIITWFWPADSAAGTPREASLLIEWAQASLQRMQWVVLAEEAESTTAAADLRLLSSRPVHIAIGVLMVKLHLDEDAAELRLRQLAARSAESVWEVAVNLISETARDNTPRSEQPSERTATSMNVVAFERTDRFRGPADDR